jgi:hypothetical protein
MSKTNIDAIAAERRLERYIEAMCVQLINDLNIIKETSNVTSDNIVNMNRVLAFLDAAETPLIQARLVLRGLTTSIINTDPLDKETK